MNSDSQRTELGIFKHIYLVPQNLSQQIVIFINKPSQQHRNKAYMVSDVPSYINDHREKRVWREVRNEDREGGKTECSPS